MAPDATDSRPRGKAAVSKLGLLKERKPLEGRVALTPAAVAALVEAGHEVLAEPQAGHASGFSDAAYRRAGATLAGDAAEVWREAPYLVKVKDPLPDEVAQLQSGQTLFCYLHLAANPALAEGLRQSGADALAFETLEADGRLPLLAPMSAIAGRLAAQVSTHLLHSPMGGKGLLLGGVAGAPRGRAVVLGVGTAGRHAAAGLAAQGAEVLALDLDPAALEAATALGANVTARYSYPDLVAEAVAAADVVIGAVLVPGARAPVVVPEPVVASMAPGGVIVDIAVDQGGCVATTRPTDYTAPTYQAHEVVHFAVANMPGAVPQTASEALSARLLPYLLRLLAGGPDQPALAGALNVRAGRIVHPAVRDALAAGDGLG